MNKKILSIITICAFSIGGLLAIPASIAFAERTYLDGNNKATINEFLSSPEKLTCDYNAHYPDKSYYYIDHSGAMKSLLNSIDFKDDGNYFPYVHRKNTSYAYIVLSSEHFRLRIKNDYTKCTVEYNSKDLSFGSVMHYTINPEDGMKIKSFIIDKGAERNV